MTRVGPSCTCHPARILDRALAGDTTTQPCPEHEPQAYAEAQADAAASAEQDRIEGLVAHADKVLGTNDKRAKATDDEVFAARAAIDDPLLGQLVDRLGIDPRTATPAAAPPPPAPPLNAPASTWAALLGTTVHEGTDFG